MSFHSQSQQSNTDESYQGQLNQIQAPSQTNLNQSQRNSQKGSSTNTPSQSLSDIKNYQQGQYQSMVNQGSILGNQQTGNQYISRPSMTGNLNLSGSQLNNRPSVTGNLSGSQLQQRPSISNGSARQSVLQELIYSDNKHNLGNDPLMAVFLQKVEIERLRNENFQWSLKYSDLEGKISQQQTSNETLRSLTSELYELRSSCSQYQNDNEKLKQLAKSLQEDNDIWKRKFNQIDHSLQTKYEISEQRASDFAREIEEWKNKYQFLQKSKDREIEELRMSFEARRKSQLDREIREITLKFNAERQQFESEIRRLREVLELRGREIEEWNNSYSELEIQYQKAVSYEPRCQEFEDRNALLAQEIERLNKLLRSKIEEIEQWRNKYGELQIVVEEKKILQFKLNDMEERIGLLSQEIERLNSLLYEKSQANDRLQGQVAVLSNDLNMWKQQSAEYEQRMILLTQEIERLNHVIVEKVNEAQTRYGQYENQISELKVFKQKCTEYEGRIGLLSGEIERLNNILRNKIDEIDQWKQRYSKIEVQLNEYKVFEAKCGEYENRISWLLKEIDEWKKRHTQLENENNELRSFQIRCQEYEGRISLLTQEIERLNQVLRNKNDDLENQRFQYAQLEAQFNEYRIFESRCIEYENRIALLSQECERLNNLLRESRADYEDLFSKHQQAIDSNRGLQYENGLIKDEIMKLKDFINQKNQEIEQMRNLKIQEYEERLDILMRDLNAQRRQNESYLVTINELRIFEARSREYEGRIALLTQEVERLNRVLKDRLDDNDNLRQRLAKAEMLINELKQLDSRCQELDQFISILRKEVEEWKQRYNNVAGFESKYKEQTSRVAILSQEIERLNQVLLSKNDDIDSLKSRVKELDMVIYELRGYEDKVRILSDEIDRLQGVIQDNEEEIIRWRNQYYDFSALDNKVKDQLGLFVLLFAEIESLRARCSNKEKEVDDIRKSVLSQFRK